MRDASQSLRGVRALVIPAVGLVRWGQQSVQKVFVRGRWQAPGEPPSDSVNVGLKDAPVRSDQTSYGPQNLVLGQEREVVWLLEELEVGELESTATCPHHDESPYM